MIKTKSEMIKFILSFALYPTMNSWNEAYGFSFNVKIHSLPLTAKEKNSIYEMLDSQEFYDELNPIIEDWDNSEEVEKFGTHTEKTEAHKTRCNKCGRGTWYETEQKCHVEGCKGTLKKIDMPEEITVNDFSAGFNGRSGGHLVLYKWNGHNSCGTGWNYNKEELDEMSKDEVKFVYDVLKEFERLYKSLLAQVKYLAKNYKVKEIEYQVTKTRRVLVEKA